MTKSEYCKKYCSHWGQGLTTHVPSCSTLKVTLTPVSVVVTESDIHEMQTQTGKLQTNVSNLMAENKKLKECVKDLDVMITALHDCVPEMKNDMPIRAMWDPQITHCETIKQCLKDMETE